MQSKSLAKHSAVVLATACENFQALQHPQCLHDHTNFQEKRKQRTSITSCMLPLIPLTVILGIFVVQQEYEARWSVAACTAEANLRKSTVLVGVPMKSDRASRSHPCICSWSQSRVVHSSFWNEWRACCGVNDVFDSKLHIGKRIAAIIHERYEFGVSRNTRPVLLHTFHPDSERRILRLWRCCS